MRLNSINTTPTQALDSSTLMVSMKVNAQSRMDFLNKLNIALKEADETEYWLDLLHETKYLDDKMYESINSDCVELIKMLTASIKKIKDNPQGK